MKTEVLPPRNIYYSSLHVQYIVFLEFDFLKMAAKFGALFRKVDDRLVYRSVLRKQYKKNLG
jgi:hypothetical protein